MKVQRQEPQHQEYPYYAYGPHYVCSLCDEVLPDGARVSGHWKGKKLDGVQVVIVNEIDHRPGGVEKTSVVHQCGVRVTNGQHGMGD